MTVCKDFHLGDILSITTDRLVSPRLIAGVYDILNFMTDDNLYTHQLPRAMDECRPHLLGWHPQLAEVDTSGVGRESWREWLDEQVRRYGEYLRVERLPPEAHERIDPLSELAEKIHPSKTIVVQT